MDAFAHKIAYIVLKEFERMFELTNNNGSVILSKKEVKTE